MALSPVIQEATASNRLAPLIAKTASARVLADWDTPLSTWPIADKKGSNFSANWERLSATCGKLSVTVVISPLTMEPAKPPSISPSCISTLPPSPTIQLKPGIWFRAPRATSTASRPPTIRAKPPIPERTTPGEAKPRPTTIAAIAPKGPATLPRPLKQSCKLRTPVDKNSLNPGTESSAPSAVITTGIPNNMDAMPPNPCRTLEMPTLPKALTAMQVPAKGRATSAMPLNTCLRAARPLWAVSAKPGIWLSAPNASIRPITPPIMRVRSASPLSTVPGEGIWKPPPLPVPPFFPNRPNILSSAPVIPEPIFQAAKAAPTAPTMGSRSPRPSCRPSRKSIRAPPAAMAVSHKPDQMSPHSMFLKNSPIFEPMSFQSAVSKKCRAASSRPIMPLPNALPAIAQSISSNQPMTTPASQMPNSGHLKVVTKP